MVKINFLSSGEKKSCYVQAGSYVNKLKVPEDGDIFDFVAEHLSGSATFIEVSDNQQRFFINKQHISDVYLYGEFDDKTLQANTWGF